MSAEPDTLLHRLALWTERQPDKLLFTYVDSDGKETKSLSYKDVATQAGNLAVRLLDTGKRGYGLQKGDTALLVFLPSLEFIVTFLACLRAGIIAVPVYPPVNVQKSLKSFASIAERSGARVALTHTAFASIQRLQRVKSFFTRSKLKWPDVKWVAVDKYLKKAPKEAEALWTSLDQADMQDTAFLQFTSGSTSLPKGVVITHSNLAHNLHTIVTALRAVEDTVVVSWLPQYHDMGLIGSYLGTLYCGGRGIYMSPVTFVVRPPLWIETISKYKATHIQGPNFSYFLSARKFNEERKASGNQPAAGLDLSSLRHIFNAAEPVTAASIDLFLETFKPYGLNPQAMCPGFGMAESTVYVCDRGGKRLVVDRGDLLERGRATIVQELDVEGRPLQRGEELAHTATRATPTTEVLVSCGVPTAQPNVDLRIVQSVTTEAGGEEKEEVKELGELEVGEMWIRSPSVAKGYWGQPELTNESFNAHLGSGDEAAGPFLRTGDLGFMHRGHLYVCGRKKDLIILRGRNVFPQDLEQSVESVANIRGGCVAAFSVPRDARLPFLRPGDGAMDQESKSGDEEFVVVVAEEALPSLAEEVRRRVMAEHRVPLSSVLLLRKKGLVKTTSGKVSRTFNRQAFLVYFDVIRGENRYKNDVVYEKHWGVTEDEKALPDVEGEEEKEGDGAASAEPRVVGGRTSNEVELREDLSRLEGQALQNSLRRDLSIMLEKRMEDVPVDVPLQEQGMDSMGLAQLAGRLRKRYRLNITNEQGLSPGLSIAWIVDNAGMLRRQPLVMDGAGGQAGGGGEVTATSEGRAGESRGGQLVEVRSAPSTQVAAVAGEDAMASQEVTDADDLQPVRRATRMERYCPCFAFRKHGKKKKGKRRKR